MVNCSGANMRGVNYTAVNYREKKCVKQNGPMAMILKRAKLDHNI